MISQQWKYLTISSSDTDYAIAPGATSAIVGLFPLFTSPSDHRWGTIIQVNATTEVFLNFIRLPHRIVEPINSSVKGAGEIPSDYQSHYIYARFKNYSSSATVTSLGIAVFSLGFH